MPDWGKRVVGELPGDTPCLSVTYCKEGVFLRDWAQGCPGIPGHLWASLA